MANLFEKPIAANPMSEFVGLPLDFIQRTMERRQSKYDVAKADMEAQEDSLLGLKFLPGDRERHMEIQEGFQSRIDSIVDEAGGDYSMVQAPLDRLKREMKREMSYGELGAQGSAYNKAMSKYKILDEMHTKGDIRQGGMNLFNQSMQDHRTQKTASGGFTPFNGYSPATEMNPLEVMHKTINEVVAQSQSDGTKGRSRSRILNGLDNLFRNNPNVVKAMKEEYLTTQKDPTDEGFKEWMTRTTEGIVDAKEYQDKIESKNATGNFTDYQLIGVQRPGSSKGSNKMTGGSMIRPKAWLGLTRESDAFFASEDGKELQAALEHNSGTTMPSDPVERVAWVEDLMEENSTINVPISGDISKVKGAVVNGRLRYNGHIVNEQGEPVDVSEVMAGTDAQNKIFVSGIVEEGDYQGSIVISAPSGTYMQENTDPNIIGSAEFQKNQLDNVAKSLTHNKNVTLHGGEGFPQGTYEIKYDAKTGITRAFQGDELVWGYVWDPVKKKKVIVEPSKTNK